MTAQAMIERGGDCSRSRRRLRERKNATAGCDARVWATDLPTALNGVFHSGRISMPWPRSVSGIIVLESFRDRIELGLRLLARDARV